MSVPSGDLLAEELEHDAWGTGAATCRWECKVVVTTIGAEPWPQRFVAVVSSGGRATGELRQVATADRSRVWLAYYILL